jgi:hypothetical protein
MRWDDTGRGHPGQLGAVRQTNVTIARNFTLTAEDCTMKGCRPLTETEVA